MRIQDAVRVKKVWVGYQTVIKVGVQEFYVGHAYDVKGEAKWFRGQLIAALKKLTKK